MVSQDRELELLRVGAKYLGVPTALGALAFSIAYAYFFGYYSFFQVSPDLVAFEPVRYAIEGGWTFIILYHAALLYIGVRYSPFGTASSPPAPKLEKVLAGACNLGFLANILLAVFRARVSAWAVVLGTLVGLVWLVSRQLRALDMKITVFVLTLAVVPAHAYFNGRKTAEKRISDKNLRTVEFRLLQSTQIEKAFLISKSSDNYITLRYVPKGARDSAMVITVLNSARVDWFRYEVP